MKQLTRRVVKCLIGVALATCPAVYGQVQQPQDGRLLEANNMIGSGGRNFQRPDVQDPNAVIYGQVSGGRGFRGNVPYGAPNELRSTTGGRISDRFIRDSVGGTVAAPPPGSTYYGPSQTATLPPGYRFDRDTGMFVPVRPNAPAVGLDDTRIDTAITNENMVVVGSSDASQSTRTVMQASPLFGVRQFTTPADLSSMRQLLGTTTQADLLRLGISGSTLEQARAEIEARDAAPRLSVPLPGATSFDDSARPGAVVNPGVATQGGTGQGTRQQMLIPATEQSTQYAALRKALEQYRANQGNMSDEEAAREFKRLQVLRDKAAAGDQPEAPPPALPPGHTPELGPVTPPVAPPGGGTVAPGTGAAPGPVTPATRPAAVRIKSLADGVSAPTLAKVLRDAETHMRAGKFTDALETYDAALVVAPNNPLIAMGRGLCELGAGYFARSEGTFRKLLLADPALMMGRFDLVEFYGETRLQTLVNDLKAAAAENPKDTRSLILLAFLAYNTDMPDRATEFLKLARTRGGEDTLVDALLKHWGN